jgi:hypothetical protein
MTRSLRTPTLLLAGTLGLAGLAAPAQARSFPVTVSAGPGVLFAECLDHPISYSVAPPADAITWNLQLTFQAPDGTAAGTAWINQGAPTTGVETESFCPDSDLPGTYTVTGVHEVTQMSGTKVTKSSTPVTPFTFDLRLPQSKVEAKPAKKKVKAGKKLTVRVTVTDERPSGSFFGTSSAKVVLQRQQGTRWVVVAGGKDYTQSSGKAQLKVKQKSKGKTVYRVFADLGVLGTNASSTFTVKGR